MHSLPNTIQARIQQALRSTLVERLTTPHGIDRYLEAFNPSWSVFETRARVTAVRRQTEDTVTLSLQPNAQWQGFRAGQYVRLTARIDGKRYTRCFSPANSVHAADGRIELTAKINPDGVLTRHLRDHAAPGMVVTLSEADGSFALPEQRPERVLLISGGSGITPVMSMLRTLCDEGYAGRITFLHYANSASAQLYADELGAIAERHANVELLRAYADGEGGELSGLFSQQQLAEAVPDYAAAETFLCGPPGLMDRVEAAWKSDGIADRLHMERFTAAPIVLPEGEDAEGEVRFLKSERLAPNDGDTLLNQAEAAGLRPDSGCRMGICHACTCTKTAGRVRDLRNGAISDAGEEEIQLCVSVPVGTVALDL
ncbi:ferredoxin reductase [Algiphilus sp.]|uniref:ferredoxin reductase n=1 Tax=Algiphilus sp. TaxID=1872431 RepID=UPI003B522B80